MVLSLDRQSLGGPISAIHLIQTGLITGLDSAARRMLIKVYSDFEFQSPFIYTMSKKFVSKCHFEELATRNP